MAFLGRLFSILILPLILFVAIFIATSVWSRGKGSFRGTFAEVLEYLRRRPEGL